MEVSSPRRILAVSFENSSQLLSNVLNALTGSHPSRLSAASTSLAGTTHELRLETAYYAATVPVWIDLIPDDDAAPTPAAAGAAAAEADSTREPPAAAAASSSSSAPPTGPPPTPSNPEGVQPLHATIAWTIAFLGPEAAEVRAALGGLLVVFPFPGRDGPSIDKASRLLMAVYTVMHYGLGADWDGVAVAVGVGPGSGGGGGGDDAAGLDGTLTDEETDWAEALCAECGFEFVHIRRIGGGAEAKKDREERNEFGEKMGIPRVLEALQANDWTPDGGGADGGLDFLTAHSDEEDGSDWEDVSDGGFGAYQGASSAAARSATDLDPSALDFGFDREDFAGLRQAILEAGKGLAKKTSDDGEDEDEDSQAGSDDAEDDEDGQAGDEAEVERVERLARRLLAAREAGEGLPEGQRRRLAARAVGEVMKEL